MFEKLPGKIVRRMGYLSDQKGILDRYFRESENWQHHLQNCKSYILDEVTVRKPESITVLGSGWLLDFPLDELLDKVQSFSLIDIYHPPQIRAKARKSPNIALIEADITGGLISSIFNLVENRKKVDIEMSLKNLDFQISERFSPDSFIISLNILNQLDIILVDYLRKFFDINSEIILDFRKNIQKSHLDLMGRNKGILISDIKERQRNIHTGKMEEKNLVHIELPEAENTKKWIWEFDRSGNYIKETEVEMEVIAISF